MCGGRRCQRDRGWLCVRTAVTGRGRKSKGNTLISGIKFQFAACALCLRRSRTFPLVLIQFAAHFYDLSLRLRRDTCRGGSRARALFIPLTFLPSMFRPPALSLTPGLWQYFLVTEQQGALEIFHLAERGRQRRAHRFINAVA